jgi:hypothetical protein
MGWWSLKVKALSPSPSTTHTKIMLEQDYRGLELCGEAAAEVRDQDGWHRDSSPVEPSAM